MCIRDRLVVARGTNGNDLLGMANSLEITRLMLDRGADPTIRDTLHGGAADGWADFGGYRELAALLRERA